MSNTLVVIIPDKLSVLVNKGEIIPRYYNPGNVFSEVHIMMTNDDQPDPKAIQLMVGDAKLQLHNIEPPPHFFRNTLGWQFALMSSWVDSIVAKVGTLKPSLVRTHNNFLEGYLAAKIKQKLNVHYVTSLHGIWDIDCLDGFKTKVHSFFRKKMERACLTNSDAAICVYSPIIDYARRYGAKNIHLIQNFVGGDYIRPKTSWELGATIKLITVNRQLKEKNPSNIIKALALLPYTFEYTLIGDGELHEPLKQLAKSLGLDTQVKFVKSLNNEAVCAMYQQSDFMVSNCHYKGISKTIIEAGLSALPVVLNRYNDGYQLEEYSGGWIEECVDTPEGYAQALDKLIKDDIYRKSLAQQALTITQQNFSPASLENKVATIYRQLAKT